LLDYASAHQAFRVSIVDISGSRAQWLMRLNPHWQFAVSSQEDPKSIWSTGKRDQRIAAINRLRQSNPAVARDLIASTWKEDAAEDRATFVSSLLTNLGADDELSQRWLGDTWEPNRKALDELFRTLGVRRDMQREFQS
jgi:hypothetical protein